MNKIIKMSVRAMILKKFFKFGKNIQDTKKTYLQNMNLVLEELKAIIIVKSDRRLITQSGRSSLERHVITTRGGREIIGHNDTSRGYLLAGINNELSKMYQGDHIPVRNGQEPIRRVTIPMERYIQNCNESFFYNRVTVHGYYQDNTGSFFYIVDNLLDNDWTYDRKRGRNYFINKYTKKCSCEAYKYRSHPSAKCKHAKEADRAIFRDRQLIEYYYFVLVMKSVIGFHLALDICSTIKY